MRISHILHYLVICWQTWVASSCWPLHSKHQHTIGSGGFEMAVLWESLWGKCLMWWGAVWEFILKDLTRCREIKLFCGVRTSPSDLPVHCQVGSLLLLPLTPPPHPTPPLQPQQLGHPGPHVDMWPSSMTLLENLKLKQRDVACAQIHPICLPKREDIHPGTTDCLPAAKCELRRFCAEKETLRHIGAPPWVPMALWLLASHLPAHLKTFFGTYLEQMI